MNEQLVLAALELAPGIIGDVKALFAIQNPTLPEPTDEEVIAACHRAIMSTLAKDALWLSQNGVK